MQHRIPDKLIPFICFRKPHIDKVVNLMLDNGSEISVIKIGMLSNNEKMEQNNEIIIKGICESPIATLGKVQMTLFGHK